MTQESALVKRCQHGDQQAFDELIRLHYDGVFRFLVKLTQDPPLAEDLTQETFLKMIRSIELYIPAGTASFRTWLLTIAKNCCIDHMRRSRIPPISTERLALADDRDYPGEVEDRLRFQALLQELDTLPPEQALAIRLKYVEDLSLQEIAAQAGVPAKTIKSRIHEGVVKLRRKLTRKERMENR